jgi:hypothetical protein
LERIARSGTCAGCAQIHRLNRVWTLSKPGLKKKCSSSFL